MENQQQQISRVSRLIFREITGIISEKDRCYLDHWREEHPENEVLYQKLVNRSRLSEELHQMRSVDILRPLEDMHLRILREERRKRRIMLQRVVSVAALIVLFLGTFYWFNMNRPEKIVVNQPTITAGGVKAILHLDNGRMIDLDTLRHGMMQGGVSLVKTDVRKLAYASQDSSVAKSKLIYNEIEVPRGGEFDLILADGSVVWLNAESKLRFPVNFNGRERRVFLEGEAYFQVKKNTDMPFRVEVRNQTVEVLGTEFNVTGYRDESHVYTTLVTGKVKVQTMNETLALVPGEQSIVDSHTGHIDKQKVDIEKVISWKKGMFILEEQTLEQIMQKFARWYDISVFYQHADLKSMVFKGVVPRYAELQDVLKILEKTNEVRFNLQNRTVIVSR